MLEILRVRAGAGLIQPPIAGLGEEWPSELLRARIAEQQPEALAVPAAADHLGNPPLLENHLHARMRRAVAVGRSDDAVRFDQQRGEETFAVVVSGIADERIRPASGGLRRKHVQVALLVDAFGP